MWNLFVQVIIAGVVIKVRGDRNCSIDHNGFPNDACTFDLRMRGAQPAQSDQYYCTGYRVTEDILGHPANSTAEGYIVKYEALADANTAHHILVFGCKSLRKDINSFWQCGYVCEGDQIIFAWAKNAPPLTLPKDVGQHIGHGTNIHYIVIQIHYAVPLQSPDTSGIRLFITEQRQKFISGIYLLLSYGVTIPEQTEKFHIDSSCRFNWRDSIVPFGFRTHAHSLGRVISGYRVNSGEYDLIGKGNPQWPQAFYPVKGDIAINPGDILAARCTYNSTGRGRATYIGSTSEDEMCNFYIMYYMNATLESQRGVDTCEGNTVSWVFDNIPTDSDTPLPFNPALEDVAMGHHHHHAMTGGGDKEEGKPAGGLDKISPPGNTIVAQPGGKTKDIGVALDPTLGLEFVSGVETVTVGQVGGLAIGKEGELFVFHRGENIWTSFSFDMSNKYTERNRPIEVDTILILHRNGSLKHSFGKNWFYLPHGLTVDSRGNIWVTDVALHQVFRIPAGQEPGKEKVDMTLGVQFEPGSDKEHFCKPTDVAVLQSGEFFVADGYCNSRIMKFDENGYFMQQFGSASYRRGGDGFPAPGTFSLPHGLALAEDKGQLCVADRENGRIQCFDLQGNFIRQIHPPQFGAALYALEYCPNHGGLLFAVNGPSLGSGSPATQGFTIDINTGNLLSMWNRPDTGLSHPHDVTVDTRDHVVYVGELNPSKIWTFRMDSALYAANKTVTNSGSQLPSVVVNAGSSTGVSGQYGSSDHSSGTLVQSNSGQQVDTASTGTSDPVLPGSGSSVISEKVKASDSSEGLQSNMGSVLVKTAEITNTEEDMGPSLIIGALLVVPVVLLIVITVLVRLYHTGRIVGKRKSTPPQDSNEQVSCE
ncbi:peptidyl-glycine alpha-amidating monooxygenase-like isoform X2 [Mya arenaria]|uniref:peptidyl-glycine alpha-amidating monooxygenase-like isoform X2 n=1 Tax=Mya arenaria TaxID=6604 RepID=UPI0022E93A6C|nr:peptidyl-glycine alpha-amidating monooxygenase-like isoform X2 [Mya arenaria]